LIKRVFPIIALAVFSAMLGGSIIAPLLPQYVSTMGATGIGIGAIFASYSVSKAVVMPLVGRYSDQLGRKGFLAVGLFSFAILSLAYIWADSMYQLILIRVVQGFAGGMILPVARAFIGDLTPVGQEGRWMGYFNFAFFAGMGSGPVLGGLLYDFFSGSTSAFGGADSGMVAAFGAMGTLSLLAFLGVIIFLPNLKDKRMAMRRKPSFREMGRSNHFKALFSQRIMENMARRCIFAFLPVFGGIVLGLSATEIGLLILVNTLFSSLLQPVSGHIVDRLNKTTVIFVAGLAAAVYMSLAPSANSFVLLMAIMVLNGLRSSLSSPAVSGMVVREGRRYGMATAMATFSFAVAVGEAVGPMLAGAAVDIFGGDSRVAFYLGALLFLAGALLFRFFMGRPEPDVAAEVSAAEGNGDEAMVTLKKGVDLHQDT